MNSPEISGEAWSAPSVEQRERMLLEKLADHYCGIYLVQVFGGLIHNLNNPLQVILVRSEQLDSDADKLKQMAASDANQPMQEVSERICNRISSLSKSVNEVNSGFLFLSNEMVLQASTEPSKIDINKFIDNATYLLNANMFFKHKVSKVFNLDKSLPLWHGQRSVLGVILLHLVQNALEAMAQVEQRILTIETMQCDGALVIRVGDTGVGIQEQHRDAILKPFFTTKKGMEYEGDVCEHMGIGLSIVSLLVEKCGGRLEFKSAPGKTVFSILLPACESNRGRP